MEVSLSRQNFSIRGAAHVIPPRRCPWRWPARRRFRRPRAPPAELPRRRRERSVHHLRHGVGRHVLGFLEEGQTRACSASKSTRIRSPPRTCSVAIRLESGCTRRRSMARFRWRAPYFRSVPSRSRNSRRRLGQREHERRPAGRAEDALLHDVQFDRQDLAQLGFAQRPEHHHLVDAVHELRRELAPRRFHARARDLVGQLLVHHAAALAGARPRRPRIPGSAAESNSFPPRPGCWS